MRRKKLRDHNSIREVIHAVSLVLKDYLLLFKEWITDYGKVFLPLLMMGLVAVTVFVSLNARTRVEAAAKEALELLEENKTEVNEVQEILFEEDAYPEVNKLIYRYYDALEMADLEVLMEIQKPVTQTEAIRLQKMSDYIETYEGIHVYTKPGPYIDTFLAYVYSDVYLVGRNEFTPGLQSFFICKDENGDYYINNGELTDEEEQYIKDIAKQSDVVDLKNSVNVAYSRIMEENPELSEYWANLSIEIDLAVSEELSLAAKLNTQVDISDDEDGQEEIPDANIIRRVKVTEKVNVRKSASATADKLGKANAGDVFILLETMVNGWSKISYESKEGYIKSEYLTEVEDVSQLETMGVVTVIDTSVNVRADASKTAKKLGVLLKGQTADLIEYVEGGEWCKIKFSGQVGYISSKYVE